MSDGTLRGSSSQPSSKTARAMDLIFGFIDELEAKGNAMDAERRVWQEVGALFEVMAPFEALCDNDLRHAIGAIFLDASQGPERFAWRIEQVLSNDSNGVLRNPDAVADAIRTVGTLFYTSSAGQTHA